MMTILDLSFLEVFFGLVGIAAGGFLRGFLGFGAALLIVPVLSLVMAPVEAIAILVLIELPNIVYLIPRSMRECELKTVAPMMCGLIIAVPLGTTLLVFVDPVKMKFVISIVSEEYPTWLATKKLTGISLVVTTDITPLLALTSLISIFFILA